MSVVRIVDSGGVPMIGGDGGVPLYVSDDTGFAITLVADEAPLVTLLNPDGTPWTGDDTINAGTTAGSAPGVISGDEPDGSLPTGWFLNNFASDDTEATAAVTAATQTVDGVECIEITVTTTQEAFLEVSFGGADGLAASEGEVWKVAAYVKASGDLSDPYLDLFDDVGDIDLTDEAVPTAGSLASSLREAEGAVSTGATIVNAVMGALFPDGTTTLLISAKLEQIS